MKKIILKLNTILIILMLFPFNVDASILSLSSQEDQYSLGDNFIVDVLLDVEEECVNTIEATINFSSDLLNLTDFVVGESILSMWIEKPSSSDILSINEEGKIYFAGGIPGGYCGKIPGDPGESNKIASLYFSIPSFLVSNSLSEDLKIDFLGTTRVLINDGLGTEDKISTKGLVLKLKTAPTSNPDKIDQIIKNDKLPPEPFVVELQQQDGVYEGKYFIIFSSIDKQSGVDHFEVMEYRPEEAHKTIREKIKSFLKREQGPLWIVSDTPHLLKDQELRSIIKVKAVDKAGNERLVEYIPPYPVVVKNTIADYLILSLIVLLFIIIVFVVIAVVIKIFKHLAEVIRK